MRLHFLTLFALFAWPLLAQKPINFCAAAKLPTACCPLTPPPPADLRSDSIDILNTSLLFDLSNPPALLATAELLLTAKLPNITQVRLDLEPPLIVDGVSVAGAPLTFSHDGPTLLINIPNAPAPGDTLLLEINYHGIPPQDVTGWGGVYDSGNYFFNLGVGFGADPHSFGRAWFPCFDNFVERCAFDFQAITIDAMPAWCNGALLSDTPSGLGFRNRHWRIEQPIPSYLACFASGPYVPWQRSVPGVNGPIPVEIAALSADTNKVKATFQHLPQAVEAFEDWYGPFRWNKIGYSLVPFDGGAMEHATNIAVGRGFIDGSLTYETLWAHELSHHWWGDLATCTTAEDMWLNEGWAVYSEHLFTEHLYGEAAFRKAVRDNHLNVLQTAHVAEGGYRAVSGVPHEYTYGQHIYGKGPVVAHNLRGYLGDSLFRVGIRAALEQTQFDDWSSADFRDKLQAATGKDLTNFFEDWVFSGGYVDFSIDSVQTVISPIDAPTMLRVFVKQKLRGALHFHHNVPLEFTFLYANGNRTYRTAVVSGENSVVEFLFPAFSLPPHKVWLNTRQRLLLARSESEKVLTPSGSLSFPEAKMTFSVMALPGSDSVRLRVEHHFSMPDTAGAANPHHFRLTNRWWTIDSPRPQFPTDFDAQGSVFYDGRGEWDQLDAELFAQTSPSEDSILLLYRPGAGHPWQEYPQYTKNPLGTTNNKYGLLRFDHVVGGQYTIAKGVSTVATREPAATFGVKVSPNPARQRLTVAAEADFDSAWLVGAAGDVARTWSFQGARRAELPVSDLPAGTYWLLLQGKKGQATAPVIIQ